MPKDPLGILKPRTDNSDPLGILKKKEDQPQREDQKPQPQREPEIIPVQKRFSDIFSAESILDRDLASTSAESLTSANNIPAPTLSLTSFNQQQASKNSLAPSFEDARQAKIHSVKNDPEELKKYRKQRVSQIDSNISNLKNKMLQNVDPATTSLAGLAVPLSDPTAMFGVNDDIKQQEDYKEELTKSIADTASVTVPKSFFDKGKTPNIEEVGKKFLETVGYASIKDDERVLSQLKDAKLDDEDKSSIELTSQTIRNRFYKEGAAALSAYHVNQAEEIKDNFPDKLKRYTDLLNLQKTKPSPETKSSISFMEENDPDIKSFAENASSALRYADESATSSKYFPQVEREEKRQRLNDIFFAIQEKKSEDRANSLNPFKHIGNALSAIMGEDPSDEDIKRLSDESGLPEAEVKSIVNDGKEGYFGKARKGVRVGGALTGISQAADQTLASSVMGLRRLFNVDEVDSKNALLQTKSDAYDMTASGNTLYDKAGNLNLNPFSIANTAGRGIGQMAVFAAPTLVTGGLAEGLLAPELVAAGKAGKSVSAASSIVKGVEALTTHAAGYIGSYESAYKEIAAYTDDEETRRGYANVVAHANAGAEHLMSPADIAKRMGVGAVSKEALIKSFIKDGEKFGVQETVARRLGQAGLKMLEVAGAENVEEQATNLVTNTADAAYMDKARSASQLADQFWQTLNTTTVNMLPMMVGAGIGGMNDMSSIKKESLFEVGNEPDAIKARLKNLLDNNNISQEKYNQKLSVVNTMQEIVAKVNKLTKKDGTPLSYDEKAAISAQQFRLAHNNNIKANGAIEAQATQVDADNKEAIAEQNAILDNAPLYKVNGEVVSEKEAKTSIESDNNDIVEIKNDPELNSLLQSKRKTTAPVVSDDNSAPVEPTLQDVLEKPVVYNGMSGTIVRDGMQYVFQQDNSNREYVIEPSDDYESKPVSDLGIHPIEEPAKADEPVDNSSKSVEAIQAKISVGEPLTQEDEKYKKLHELSGVKFEPQKTSEVSLNDDNTFTIRGNDYVNNYSDPFKAINIDENGYVVSVDLETKDGKKRTFRGDAANDIAYQMHLKEITKDNATRTEFEDFINTDEQSAAEIRSAAEQSAATGATDNSGAATETASSSPNSDNGEVQAATGAEAGTEPAAGSATAGTANTDTGGAAASEQSGAGQQQSGRTAAVNGDEIYDSPETFKAAFDKLSDEDKAKYGDLIANDQHDEAHNLLAGSAVQNRESVRVDNGNIDVDGKGVSVSDADATNTLLEEVKNEPYKASLIKRAKIIFGVLQKLIPHVEIHLHNTTSSFKQAISAFGVAQEAEANFVFGTNNGKPLSRIDIDLSTARLGVIAHEATHAVLQHIFPNSPEVFSSFKNRLSKIVEKSTDEYLNKFVENYKDKDVKPEEYLAELGAVIQTNDKAIKPTLLHNVKALINLVTTKALGRSISPETESIEAVKNFFVSMNRAFKTGEVNVGDLTKIAAKAGVAVNDKAEGVSSRQSLLFNENDELKFKDKGATVSIDELVSDLNHPTFKPLFNWFKTKYSGSKKIHIYGGRGVNEGIAFADHKNKFIALNKNHPEFGKLKDQDYLDKVIAHEIIHEVISDSIRSNKRVMDLFNKDLGGLVSIISSQDFSDLDRDVVDTIERIKNGSPEELAAYALTDTKLAQYLDTVSFSRDGQKSTSVWGKIKDLIIGILYGKNKSVLGAVVDTLDKYVGDFRNNSIFYKPDTRVGEVVKDYVESTGQDYIAPIKISKLDTDKSRRIADEYEKMKHDPANPDVIAAYTAMADETKDQYALVSKSYDIEVFNKEGEPYKNSKEMIDDLVNNNHLYIFATESGFGEGKITDEQRAENPLLAQTEFKDVNGVPLLVNDLFRAVHDIIGHGELGNSFGAVGEENAWMTHSRMYSPLARRAMTTETRGQNSWVNFSGNNVSATGKIAEGNRLIAEGKKEEGEKVKKEGQNEFRFADQKIGLLPEWVSEDADNSIQSRQSLTPLDFGKRKQRLDTARKAGALSEEQYQKALDKALSSTGTNAEEVLTPEEQSAYDNFFNKNARPVSLAERVSNITIPDTDLSSPYSANKTFEKAGFGSKGRPAQGNTTTIPLMIQANVDFINQLISEGSDAIHNLLNYFGLNENAGKLARDFNMEGLKTLNDYRLANVLFAYINQAPLSELNISPEQVKRYSQYLKKFSSELGREIGQSLNTAKIRKVAGSVLGDMILESTLSASEYNAISEAEDAIVNILSGDAPMSDEELAAAEDLYFETELEKEKQAKQSTLLGKLLNLKSKEDKLSGEVSESKSKKIIDRINKQLNKTKEDIKDIINKIKCD